MTGTIAQLDPNRGVGALRGEDGKRYTFRRSDVRELWFHEFTEGMTVAFDPGKDFSAHLVRHVSSEETR